MARIKSKAKVEGGRLSAAQPSALKGKKSAAETKQEKDLARLQAWKQKARKDPAYRKREAAAEQKRKQALRDDAEFGRACRMFFDGLKQVLELMGRLSAAQPSPLKRKGDGEGEGGKRSVAQPSPLKGKAKVEVGRPSGKNAAARNK